MRRFTNRPAPPERIARALIDAESLGDKRAGIKHGVHAKTIYNWRVKTDDAVRAEMARLRAATRDGWIDEAKAVRRKALERIGELLNDARNLTSAVNAARRVHEIILSDEILREDPGAAVDALDDQPHEPDQSAHPGEAQGALGGEGDEGPGDLGGGEG